MKNAAYWAKRSEQILLENERKGTRCLSQINRVYHNTAEDIDREIRKVFKTYQKDFSAEQARKWLNESIPKAEYDALKEQIPSITDERLRKELLMRLNAPAYQYRITRLGYMKQQILTELTKAASAQKKLSTDCFGRVLENSYNKTMFMVQQGTGIAFSYAQIPEKVMNGLLSSQWYGRNYSASVWRNTRKAAAAAGEVLKEGILGGQSVETMSKALMEKTYTESMTNAARLVRTEVNYFSGQGTAESYKEAEIDEYEFMATLDLKTSTLCREHDGKVYRMEDMSVGENYPPLHPYCRSTTAPIISVPGLKRMERRAARDPVAGKTINVENMEYDEWKKRFAKGSNVDRMQKMSYNEAADRKQWQNYRDRLGDNAPKSFSAFQTLKYNDLDGYKELAGFYSYKGRVPEATKKDYKAYKAIKDIGVIGSVRVPASSVDADVLILKDSHALRHGCTLEDANQYIKTAKCSISRQKWDGLHINYYSFDGATYINADGKINTVFSKKDFDPKTKAILEVFK